MEVHSLSATLSLINHGCDASETEAEWVHAMTDMKHTGNQSKVSTGLIKVWVEQGKTGQFWLVCKHVSQADASLLC